MYEERRSHGRGTATNTDNDDAVAGAALIDSFFLPGGILDPEAEDGDDKNINSNNDGSAAMNDGPGHDEGRRFGPQQLGHGHGHNLVVDHNHNRTSDSLRSRSRLEQLAIGGKALEYDHDYEYVPASSINVVGANNNYNCSSSHSAITMPRNMKSPPAQEPPRVGVAALDPTSDDVVGGRPILMGNPNQSSVPVVPLGMHSHSSNAPIPPASGSVMHTGTNLVQNTEYNSDWFSSGNNTRMNQNSISGGEDGFAHFFRGALQTQNAGGNGLLPSLSSPTTNGPQSQPHAQQPPTQPLSIQHSQLQSHYPSLSRASISNSSNESRTTSATSHVRRNPWSGEDLSSSNAKPHLNYTHAPGPSQPCYNTGSDSHASASASLGNFPSSNPLTSKHSIPPVQVPAPVRSTVNDASNIQVTQPGVRPPPGFLSASVSSQTQPQQVTPSSTEELRVTRHHQHEQQQHHRQREQQHSRSSSNRGQIQDQCPNQKEISRGAPISSSSSTGHDPIPYSHPHSLHHQHQQHHHEQLVNNNGQQTHTRHAIAQQNSGQQVRHVMNSDQQQQVQQQLHTSHAPQRKAKAAPIHHNDGDYDQNSLNTKSSRDIPSTIYVEEDAVSTSEDTLTVCADSVTEVSVQKTASATKVDNEMTCMDVVEEASAAEQKRNKPKRNKKKKSRKKQNVQESVKSLDNSAQETVQRTITSHDNQQKSDSEEEESKETKKKPKAYKKSPINKKGLVLKSQSNSRSSAATTAISSTNTTVQRVVKRSHSTKPANLEKHQIRPDEGRRLHLEMKPREPLGEIFSRWLSKCMPVAVNAFHSLISVLNYLARFLMAVLVAAFPKKERFWFFLPAICVIVDFTFLAFAIIAKVVGQIIYALLMVHKLALLELMESDSAAMCYTVLYFYPNLVTAVKASIPNQNYWPVFVRWLVIDRWLCRSITMKDTYLYRLKKRDRRESEMNIVKLHLITGEHLIGSLKDAVGHILRISEQDEPEESERVTMANHILQILRKMTPLILMLEVNIRREGFMVLMTSTERILFGYGFAVLRSGYLFSPFIWISWTIQLTIIMFVVPSPTWSYFTFLIGLVSIRLSHYTAALEDLEGINAMNRNSTSRFRKNASRLLK